MHFWCQGDPTPANPLDGWIRANSVGLCNTWLDVIVVESHNLPNPDVVFHPVPPAAFQTLLFFYSLVVIVELLIVRFSLNLYIIKLFKITNLPIKRMQKLRRWPDVLAVSLSFRCSVYGELWAEHKWIPVFHLHCENRMVWWWKGFWLNCYSSQMLMFLLFSFRLDGKHVVFGQVKEGMGAVAVMESCGLHDGGTVKKIVITDSGELK